MRCQPRQHGFERCGFVEVFLGFALRFHEGFGQ